MSRIKTATGLPPREHAEKLLADLDRAMGLDGGETVEQALERELAKMKADQADRALLNSFELGCLRQRMVGFDEAARALLDSVFDGVGQSDEFIYALGRLRAAVNLNARHPSADVAQQALTEMRAREGA